MFQDQLKAFLKQLRLNESAISTALGAVVVVTVGVLIYNYFSRVNQPAQETAPEPEARQLVEENGQLVPDNLPQIHTVAAGENLWQISIKYFDSGYNWVDIARENRLANANKIEAGQKLTIPRVAVKTVEKPQTASPAAITAGSYTVQKGDSLWQIAVRAYGDGFQWTKIYEANRKQIARPNVIEAGMVLQLPR
jgi:nucleoid-associated protein YgaU